MIKVTKTVAVIMLLLAVVCTACTKNPDNGGNDNGGNGSGNGGGNGGGGNGPGTELPAGMYLGVIGFNERLYTSPIVRLDDATIQQTEDFIDGLNLGGATLLYHAVYTSLDMLAASGIPSDLQSVSIVNFTDGLDEGSYTFSNYSSGAQYLQAVTQRIRNEIVGTKPIGAHTIGIKGNDVHSYDEMEFNANLEGISSLPDEQFDTYVHSVSTFDEVREAFREIARRLHDQSVNSTLTLRVPAPDPNTRVRFTFDIMSEENDACLQSNKYIEGVYITNNAGMGVLTNVQYHGLESLSGNYITAVRMDRPFAVFEIEGVTYTDGSDFNNQSIANLKEWKYKTSGNVWCINSEWTNSGNTEITDNYHSALVMLNLDCSESLGSDQFELLKTYAKEFVEVLKTH
jgi:hypothetical protein